MTDPSSQNEKDLQRALALVRFMRDPALPGMALMATLLVTGFVALWFAWHAAARTLFVPLQVPALVSGGLGALALIGLGAALLDLQAGRSFAAHERRQTDDLLDEIGALIVKAPELRRRVRRS